MGIVFPLGPWDGAVPVDDAWTWAHWVPGHDKGRRVLLTSFPDFYISTIDLGFDPRCDDAIGPPLLWETLVLGGPLDRREELHASREEGIRRHLELMWECLALRDAAADAGLPRRVCPRCLSPALTPLDREGWYHCAGCGWEVSG